MNIEQFLEFFPKEIQETKNQLAGFSMRYSTSRKKWLVGYGMSRTKRYEHNKNQMGCGDTLQEAIEDLVEKIKQYDFNDKYGKSAN